MSLSQLKNAQVQSSLSLSAGGGSGITGLLGNAGGSVPTTAVQPTVSGAGSVTVQSTATGLTISGAVDGVGSLIGSAGGSVATTAVQPVLTGAGGVVVSSTTAGLTVTGTTGKYFNGSATIGARASGAGTADPINTNLFAVNVGLISGVRYSVSIGLSPITLTGGTPSATADYSIRPYMARASSDAPFIRGSSTNFLPCPVSSSGAVLYRYPSGAWSATETIGDGCVLTQTFFDAGADPNIYVNFQVTNTVFNTGDEPNTINWTGGSCTYDIALFPLVAG
jgi:hypothetical protein